MRTSPLFVLALLLPVLSGCPFAKKKSVEGEADAAASTPTASTVAPATPPAAANEKTIARYADEKTVSKDTVINWTVAGVTEAAGAGKTITLLKKGTAVSEVAQHAKFGLVTFKDPKDASRTLMGWVNEDVFGDEPLKAKVALSCKPGEKIVRVPKANGLEEQCQRPCNADTNDCTGGLDCLGVGADKNDPNVLVFFCQKAPPPPPLVCSAGETKLRVRFPSGFEDNDCVRVCSSGGATVAPDEADKKCPAGFFCGGVGIDAARTGFCTKGKRAATAAAATAAPPTAAPPTAAKVKCVLPSPPPCAAPHAESPKGLCQVPCPTGNCSACGGTCQKGFCVSQ